LPRDHVAPANPCAPEASRQRRHPRLEPGAVEADSGRVVDDEVTARVSRRVGHGRVERRDVPRATRCEVLARSGVAIRRPECHVLTTGSAGGPLGMLDI
jgi:hypothetical protein